MTDRKKPDLEENELVRRLTSDRSRSANLTVLRGYLGKSDREGYWRLYPTPDMKDFIEIAETDIVHSESLETRDNPLGGTMIWVNSDAEIIRTQTDRLGAQAGFLSGSVMGSSSAARNRAAAGPIGDAGTAISTAPCWATITLVTAWLCKTVVLDCYTEDCWSQALLCTLDGYPRC